MTRVRRVRRGVGPRSARVALVGTVAVAAACGPSGPPPLRAWTDDYEFHITSDPSPPRAREPIVYRVVVLDRKSHQVVEGGEGQIFATSQDHANTYDSFTSAPEAGTYTARITYITAGDWKVGIRFRRDSTAKLERIEDWTQTVRGARPIGERPIQ